MSDFEEFTRVMVYLAMSVGKESMPEGQVRIYYDVLGDLPPAALKAAAQKAVAKNQYPTVPPIGVIRGFAADLMMSAGPDAEEAWALALGAVQRYGEDDQSRALLTLPKPVADALSNFGYRSLCNTADSNLPTVRAQFVKFYAMRRDRERDELQTPPSVRALAEQVAKALPGPEKGGLRAVS